MTAASSVAADSGRVALWTLVSRLTGFARVFVIAGVLGPTHFGNLFQLANQLPWILYELVAGSLLASLIVPALVDSDRRGEDSVSLARGVLTVVLVGFAGVSALAMAFSPVALSVLARLAAVSSPDYRTTGAILVALTAPQLVAYGVVAVAVAAQNARGKFARGAALPAVENLVVIGFLVVYAIRYGTGAEVGAVPLDGVIWLGAGSTVAVIIHAWLQCREATAVGIPLGVLRHPLTSPVRSVLALGRPAVATAALNGMRHLLLVGAAGTVAGGVVAYNIAIGFLNLPTALGARPVATAQLPVLSRLALDDGAFRAERRRGLSLAALLVVPSGLAFIGLAPVLAAGIAWGELGSSYGRSLAAAAIAGIGLGVWGEGLYQLGTPASYARREGNPPLWGMVVRFLGVVLGAGYAVLGPYDGATLVGLLLMMASVADIAGASVTYRMAGQGAVDWRHLARVVGVAAAVVIPVSWAADGLRSSYSEPPSATLLAGLAGALAVGVPLLVGIRRDQGLADALRDRPSSWSENNAPAPRRPDDRPRSPQEGQRCGPSAEIPR